MKTLTVSIAAYNVEKYIEKTLDSLCCSCVLEDMEILVQTNAATDDTVRIAKQYEEKYPDSIRVLERQINGGYGSTINDSIAVATGKYFKTLDGDDCYDTNNLADFIAQLKSCETDIVISEFSTFTDDKLGNRWSLPMEPNKEYTVEMLTDCRMHSLTVRTEILQHNDVSITENCFYTDIEYFLKAVKYSKNFRYIPLNIYCYRVGYDEQSVSLAGHLKHLDDYELIVKKIISDFYFDPKFHNMSKVLQWKILSHLRFIAMKKPYTVSKTHFLDFFAYLQEHKVELKPQQFSKPVRVILALILSNPKRWFWVFRLSAKAHNALS